MRDLVSSNPPARDKIVTLERVVELLAPALGEERSDELVRSSVRSLGYSVDRVSLEQVLEILLSLGAHPGIVGVAARFARARLLSPRKAGSSAPHPLAVIEQPAAPASRKGLALASPTELAALLAPTLGAEKSDEIVAAAIVELGLSAGSLEERQALAIFDLVAKAQGIVGIAARFAKARLILKASH